MKTNRDNFYDVHSYTFYMPHFDLVVGCDLMPYQHQLQ